MLALLLLAAVQFRHVSDRPAGWPVAVEFAAPADFNPDSVRVRAEGAATALPSKTERRTPGARVMFVSTGAKVYSISYGEETARLLEPPMIGAGDRITFGRLGVRGRAAVGLWPRPAVLDFDLDGDLDLILGCGDRPSNGTYLFRNIGTQRQPLFDRGEWLGPNAKELTVFDINADGKPDLVISGGYYDDFRHNRLSKFVKLPLDRDYHVGRDDLWQPVDWDRDGRIDLLIGVSDWREYGWDDAFNEKGEWTRGPLHGYVYFHRNIGTNSDPRYAAPVQLPIDLYGSPSPQPVDWLGRGVWDLLGGSFTDKVTLFRRTGPRLGPGEALPLKLDLCMIQPRVVQWHSDGRPSLLVSEEDGTTAFFENTSPAGEEPRFSPPRYLEQVDPYLKSGVLSRPAAADWNGDGRLDIISGNSAGYLQYFENTGGGFIDRGNLEAGGKVIRRVAGPNGSIQGPAEEKWGYSNPSVADWDLDGDLDILVNDIWGSVHWYRNTGTRTQPKLAPSEDVEVEWTGAPPKPEWVWWQPKPKQLLTQWRSTPKVVDWDRDGLPDLVMLNHQGYLCLYRRSRVNGRLLLHPPERIFLAATGRFLNLAAGRAGASGRRKIEFADLDRDGDLDLVTDSDDGPVWYQNTGTQQHPVMELRGTLIAAKLPGHNPTPNLADWNGDGKPDLIIGAEDGFFYYYDGRLFTTEISRSSR